MREFLCGDTTNVDHVIYDYISHNCSHWNGNIEFKEKFGNHTRKIFSRFATRTDIVLIEHTARIVLHPEVGTWAVGIVVGSWGRSTGEGGKACDKRQWNNNNKEAENFEKNNLCIEMQRNVKHDGTSNNWSHRNGKKRINEKFWSHTGETRGRSTTQDSCTWNFTHNMEGAAYWKLKPEKKYLGVKENNNNNNNNNNNLVHI